MLHPYDFSLVFVYYKCHGGLIELHKLLMFLDDIYAIIFYNLHNVGLFPY